MNDRTFSSNTLGDAVGNQGRSHLSVGPRWRTLPFQQVLRTGQKGISGASWFLTTQRPELSTPAGSQKDDYVEYYTDHTEHTSLQSSLLLVYMAFNSFSPWELLVPYGPCQTLRSSGWKQNTQWDDFSAWPEGCKKTGSFKRKLKTYLFNMGLVQWPSQTINQVIMSHQMKGSKQNPSCVINSQTQMGSVCVIYSYIKRNNSNVNWQK